MYFNKEKRRGLINANQLLTPGPEKYMPSLINKKQQPCFRFSKEAKLELEKRSTSPRKQQQYLFNFQAPGQYQVNEFLGKQGIAYSFGQKIIIIPRQNMVDPTTYNPDYSNQFKKEPSYSFRVKLSYSFNRSISPGPGRYQINSTIFPKIEEKKKNFKIRLRKSQSAHIFQRTSSTEITICPVESQINSLYNFKPKQHQNNNEIQLKKSLYLQQKEFNQEQKQNINIDVTIESLNKQNNLKKVEDKVKKSLAFLEKSKKKYFGLR